MARRIYFAFHFENDIWRVNQVRNSNVVNGVEKAGFFDHSEYDEVKRKSDDAIARAIRERLDGTTVTVVLIGNETAARPWVQYEIRESAVRGNGFVGVYIHHLRDMWGNSSPLTPFPVAPVVPGGVEFPLFHWDGNIEWFATAVEAAGKRADSNRLYKALYPSMFKF